MAVTHSLLVRYRAAALALAMFPAGEIWSVVTESPKFNSTWADSMDLSGCGFMV